MNLRIAALAALVATLPFSADAYVRSRTGGGNNLFWSQQNFPIMWEVEATPPGGATNRTAVINAFNKWTSASCTNVTLATPGNLAASGKVADADGASRVFFQDDWNMGSSVLGLTTTFFSLSGEIAEADVEFNNRDWDWKAPGDYETCRATQNGCVDTASVAAHEAGHFFGLAHTPDQGAVMFATWSGPPKRDLATDDINGICAIYPKPSTGTGGQGSACRTTTDCQTGLTCAAKQGSTASICTATCTGTSDTNCPGQTSCQRSSTSGFACFPSAGGTQGSPCSMNMPCAFGYWCLGTGAIYTCKQDCNPAASSCASGLTCNDWSGISNPPPQNESLGGYCDQRTGPTKKKQCESCTETSDCSTGLTCVPLSADSSEGVCRNTCSQDSQCSDFPRCLPRDAFQTDSSVCACEEDLGAFGSPCLAQDKCDPGLVCVNDGTSTDKLCRTACGGSLPECPDGQYCKKLGTANACVTGVAPKTDAGTPTDDGSGGDAGLLGCGCGTMPPATAFLAFVCLLSMVVRFRTRR